MVLVSRHSVDICVRVVPNRHSVTRSSLLSSLTTFVLCIVNIKYAACSRANLCHHAILSRPCHPCVCWRRRSFSCVVSNTESVTSSSLSSSPTFGRLVFFSLQNGSCGHPNVCHRCIPSPIRHSCVSAGIVVPLFVSFVSVGLQVRHGACF